MKRIVADSSTLILLSKCSLLKLFCTSFEVIAPSSVINETASENLARNYPDAALIKDLVSEGVLKIEQTETEIQLPITLHHGEKDAITLAFKSQDTMLATDDGKAIKAARFLDIPFIISPKIVVDLFRLQKIPLEKARHAVEKLGTIGRHSPEIIADAILSLMEAKGGKTNDYKDT